MLYAGLDLSRKRLDVCLLTEEGEIVGEFGVPPDPDGLRGLIKRVGAVEVLAVIESMTGARFVHDRLEQLGWDVRIARERSTTTRTSLCPNAPSTASGRRRALLLRPGNTEARGRTEQAGALSARLPAD